MCSQFAVDWEDVKVTIYGFETGAGLRRYVGSGDVADLKERSNGAM
jgi:hypothetical protein